MMNELLAAAAEFQGFAQREGWSFVFIGGLAVGFLGEPRTTRDFDVCLFTDFGGEEQSSIEKSTTPSLRCPMLLATASD